MESSIESGCAFVALSPTVLTKESRSLRSLIMTLSDARGIDTCGAPPAIHPANLFFGGPNFRRCDEITFGEARR